MAVKRQFKLDIVDDLTKGPKGEDIVIGYQDQDGICTDLKGEPLEPIDTIVIGGKAKRVWASEESYDRVLKALYDQLSEAEDDEDVVVLTKDEYERLKARAQSGGSASSSTGRRPYGTGPARKDTKEVREWLRGHGVDISDRGRIPNKLQAAFDAQDPSKINDPDDDDDTDAHDSKTAADALAQVQNAPDAPVEKPEDDDEATDEQMREALIAHGVKLSPKRKLDEHQTLTALRLLRGETVDA